MAAVMISPRFTVLESPDVMTNDVIVVIVYCVDNIHLKFNTNIEHLLACCDKVSFVH